MVVERGSRKRSDLIFITPATHRVFHELLVREKLSPTAPTTTAMVSLHDNEIERFVSRNM